MSEKYPPRGSLQRFLYWEEWFQTGSGVGAYIFFCLLFWFLAMLVCGSFIGNGGFIVGHVIGGFIGVPAIGFLMTMFWPPRRPTP